VSERVVLVTGSTSGIGEATALRFAAAGDRVVFNSVRSVEAGERLAAATPASIYVQADIAKNEDCLRLVAEVWNVTDGSTCWSTTPARPR
jgi:ketoreductase RED2